MNRVGGALAGLAAGVFVAAMAETAGAFCGFYVAGADRELFNDATLVVMLRDGNTTVLSMQNDYRGAPEDFAMVVPVPTVLEEANVKTLPQEVFETVDTLAAPRLVEYWEQDPCGTYGTIGLGNLGTIGFGSGGGSGYGRGSGGRVRVEAEFAVGEYEIVILSADDSSALEAWLRSNDYSIPEGAAEALGPYVEGGMKFFVAKVDASKVRFEDGRAVLSPLRVHYESDDFSLPVRLGMLNSSGTQDLIVHILARNRRYEVANYENVTIPTNLEVADATRERFGEFYAALFDETLAANPRAVVTEYSWQATNCDPCPGPVLSEQNLLTLGADMIDPNAPSPARPAGPGVLTLRSGRLAVEGEGLSPEVVRRVLRRHRNEVRFCYEQAALTDYPRTDSYTFEISGSGSVTRAEMDLGNDDLNDCVQGAYRRWSFPAPEGGGSLTVEHSLNLSMTQPSFVGQPGPFMDFVLTWLHYRYEAGDLGEDLVFREASPISGGREWPQGDDGRAQPGARPDSANNFQGRYIIRHPWEGEIGCSEPQRGRWGGPPDDEPRPTPASATNSALAPRGGLQLSAFLQTPLGQSGVESSDDPNPEAEEASEEASAGVTAPEAQASGCGSCSSSKAGNGTAFLALLTAVFLCRFRSRG
ncbi:MAG: DUF2330 domain-containing protein [Myxococcota bacterium]